MLKEDTSKNKVTLFIANWKTVATSIFPPVLPSNTARKMSWLPAPTTHTLSHTHMRSHTSYIVLKHRNTSWFCWFFLTEY